MGGPNIPLQYIPYVYDSTTVAIYMWYAMRVRPDYHKITN